MRPRFNEDYRSLFWACVLFPLVPTVALARPSFALPLLPWALYLAYCSGVLAHNQNHCPVFRARRANTAYASWLSIFYGCPLFAWIPTHNQNHHQYLNGEGDQTRTTRHTRRNTLWAALSYPTLSGIWQMAAIRAYAVDAWRRHPARFRQIFWQTSTLILAHGALLAVFVVLHGPRLGGAAYLLSMGLPALFAPWSMMLTNYLQHVDCDPTSPEDHSRNFVNPLWNWFVFDNGYHTVHHAEPGVHWSRYRKLHAERAPRMDPRLNVASPLTYFFREYLVRPPKPPRIAGLGSVSSRPTPPKPRALAH